MLKVDSLVGQLQESGVDFFTGVPDSLLKSLCAYLQDTLPAEKNIIAANEGGAIGLATGHYLATNRPACVYMQNSGLGNTVNPLLSLADADVYSIPMLLIIGWRGQPGVKDEPQHVKQGKTTLSLLETMEIKYEILSENSDEAFMQVSQMLKFIKENSVPGALVVRKGVFEEYKLQSWIPSNSQLSREDAIRVVADSLPDIAAVVATTGMASRELFELREACHSGHEKDFLTVGSMGHASQIALGIALAQKSRKVVCFDGDGAVLMHLGALALIGNLSPNNFVHFVFNNRAHDSVGGQPTVMESVNLPAIAAAVGYKNVFSCSDEKNLKEICEKVFSCEGPSLIEVSVKKGARKDLGRPTTTPLENKKAFMNFLSSKEI